MKFKLFTVILVANIMTSGCTLFLPKISSPEEYRQVQQHYNELKVGMTKSEVEKLVGTPREFRTINNEEIWLLHVNPKTQGIKWPFVVFDSNTDRVKRVFLEEPDNVFYP